MIFRLIPAKHRGFHIINYNWVFDSNVRRNGQPIGCGGTWRQASPPAAYRWAARHFWWRFHRVYRWEFIG